MKSRKRVSEQVLDLLAQRLVEALENGAKFWLLPEPPLFDPGFPPIHPTDGKELSVERGCFTTSRQRNV